MNVIDCVLELPMELPVYEEQDLFNNTYASLYAPILANVSTIGEYATVDLPLFYQDTVGVIFAMDHH
jgi:hypothetical protein